jgi:hypothetical protein
MASEPATLALFSVPERKRKKNMITKRISFQDLDKKETKPGTLHYVERKGERYVNVADLEATMLTLIQIVPAAREKRQLLLAFAVAVMSTVKER